jgi:hypothetical protein
MALITRWIALAIFLMGCHSFAPQSGLIRVAQAQTPPDTLGNEMKYFYKTPSTEAATKIVKAFGKPPYIGNTGSYPPLTGFLAAVFLKYPDNIDTIVAAEVDPRGLWSTAIALRLAGQEKKAEAISARMQAAELKPPALDKLPMSLEMVQAQTPSDFDVLWGASFATGDPRYCLKILEAFRSYANKDNNAGVLVVIEREIEKGSKGDLRWVRQKWGDAKTIELIYMATALWALRSNGAQHEFVDRAIS